MEPRSVAEGNSAGRVVEITHLREIPGEVAAGQVGGIVAPEEGEGEEKKKTTDDGRQTTEYVRRKVSINSFIFFLAVVCGLRSVVARQESRRPSPRGPTDQCQRRHRRRQRHQLGRQPHRRSTKRQRDGMLAGGHGQRHEARRRNGLRGGRLAVEGRQPAGPLHRREARLRAAFAHDQPPRLARSLALDEFGRQFARQRHNAIALGRVEPRTRPRPRVGFRRQVLGADGRADVAGEPFVLGQPFGRHVGVGQDQVVDAQAEQPGGQQHEAAGDGNGRAAHRPVGGKHQPAAQQGQEERGDGQKAPRELGERQQRQVIPQQAGHRGDHEDGNEREENDE